MNKNLKKENKALEKTSLEVEKDNVELQVKSNKILLKEKLEKKKSFLINSVIIRKKKKLKNENKEKDLKTKKVYKTKKEIGKNQLKSLIASLNSIDINKDYSLDLSTIQNDYLSDCDLNRIFLKYRKIFRNDSLIQKKEGNYYRYLKGVILNMFNQSLKYVVNENSDKERVIGNCFLTFIDYFDNLIQDETKPEEEMEIHNEFFIKTSEVYDNLELNKEYK